MVAVHGGLPLTARLAKTQRQHRIARLLESHAVTSQGQVVDLLAADGVVATQATVSRDLEELGAIKVRAGGGESVYAIPDLPKDQVAPALALTTSLRSGPRPSFSIRPAIHH